MLRRLSPVASGLAAALLASVLAAAARPSSAALPGAALHQEPAPSPGLGGHVTGGRSGVEESVLARPVVIGASASAGFNIQQEVGVRVPLAQVLDTLIVEEHRPVLDAATSYFFRDPIAHAERQVKLALESDPTLVVALDFLFWFGYGSVGSPEARLQRLEHGLALLERFECPVVVADLPDMADGIGIMLRRHQVPPPEDLDLLNARIERWRSEHRGVHLVRLAAFHERLRGGERIRLRGQEWVGSSAEALLQPDRLHPSLEGTTLLAVMALDLLTRGRNGIADDAVLWSVAEAREAIWDATEDDRRIFEERRARRRARARAASSKGEDGESGAGDAR